MSKVFSSNSIPTNLRPSLSEAIPAVPLPIKGSRTVLPTFVLFQI
jgi:hypothetical protein